MNRDDFSQRVINTSKMRAAFICSNPSCKAMTLFPSSEDENLVQYIGIAAHITSASPGGPRYDTSMMKEERESISNAIFLCSNCATLIDKNGGVDYPVATLKE